MKTKILSMATSLCVLFLALVLCIGVPRAKAAPKEDIENAITDGLAWLVAQQNTIVGDPDYGSWNAYGSLEAGTGLALYKLCERAYELKKENPDIESPFDPDYEYSQNVIDGFNWLFAHLSVVEISVQNHTTGASGTLDDPDTRVNGKGVCAKSGTYQETYATGILLAAVAASGTPNRPNEGGLNVDGDSDPDTYREIAQDMVDFLAFSQVESPVPNITKEGGWDYSAVNNGVGGSGWKGDQSNSGYAVLGLAEAQDFGCTVPDWVKTELNWWIDYVQDDVVNDPPEGNEGGSWYSYPGDGIGVNILKTGNLIFEMALVGDTPDVQRVIDATDYLVRHWSDASGANFPPGWDGDPAQYQTMFCAMKGLVYMGIDTFASIDWFADFSDAIVAQQVPQDDPDPAKRGSWQSSSGRGDPVIITEWALLTLEKVAPLPEEIKVPVDIKPGSCPNPINPKRKCKCKDKCKCKGGGVLPVAVLGTEDFDVMTIDPVTVALSREGVEDDEGNPIVVHAIRYNYEDVATPFEGELCDCHDLDGDGVLDLTLKFSRSELVETLKLDDDELAGETIPLTLTGNLEEEEGGTPIIGADCVWILNKCGKKKGKNCQ